jgi:hypothetical protein
MNPVARPDAGPVHSIFSITKTVFSKFEGGQESIPPGGQERQPQSFSVPSPHRFVLNLHHKFLSDGGRFLV